MTIRNQKFLIDGMHCPECAQNIAHALHELPGTGSVDVSLENACATVQFEDGQLSTEKIIAAIEHEGLEAKKDN